MLEIGNPPYQTTGDTRTHLALIDAVTAAIPCLADWAKTTGHGATYQRDVDALRLCIMAVDVLREEKERRKAQADAIAKRLLGKETKPKWGEIDPDAEWEMGERLMWEEEHGR